MKRTNTSRPRLGACLMAATLVLGASTAQADESDRQLYNWVFSQSVQSADQVPESERLSYEAYEQCFQTYRELIAYNLNDAATQKSLVSRQESMLEAQEELALMRMKAQTTKDRAQRIALINQYDSQAQAFNYHQEQLHADIKAFTPVFEQYRANHAHYTENCTEMYYDAEYMKRLPEDLKAFYGALMEQKSTQ